MTFPVRTLGMSRTALRLSYCRGDGGIAAQRFRDDLFVRLSSLTIADLATVVAPPARANLVARDEEENRPRV